MAPTFVSGTLTGTLVPRYAAVIAAFDDTLYRSAKFVNIHEKDSITPLAVHRYAYGKRKRQDTRLSWSASRPLAADVVGKEGPRLGGLWRGYVGRRHRDRQERSSRWTTASKPRAPGTNTTTS